MGFFEVRRERGGEVFTITTDKSRIDSRVVHEFLVRSYWAAGVPHEVVERSIAGSLCFSLLRAEEQVGFARVVTDSATFAYLADVYVLEHWRGQGLGRWLVEVVLAHPELQGLRRILLATRDAHGLYERLGFRGPLAPESFMQIHEPDVYRADGGPHGSG